MNAPGVIRCGNLRERREKMTTERIKVLKMIAEDMKNDAKNFDGRPFDGRTVAEYFGNQGAAISALANIVESILEQLKK